MCSHCVDMAKKEFAQWTDDQRRTATIAVLQPETGGDITPRGDNGRYARGREIQRDIDDLSYRRILVPRIHSLRIAAAQAEEQLTAGEDPASVLRTLLDNVKLDATALPLALPV